MLEITGDNVIRYRQYTISWHALSRYVERVGGDVGNMAMDIDECWLVGESTKRVTKRLRRCVNRIEKQGGHVLTNGKVFFLVMPDNDHYNIITSITP